MKIYVHYKTTREPWGGINSFFNAFKDYINANPNLATIVDKPEDCDIFFFGSLAKGKKARITTTEIGKIKSTLKCKIVHRLDGAKSIYTRDYTHLPADHVQLLLSGFADHTVFQSMHSVASFQALGYRKKTYSVIHNGVNQEVFKPTDTPQRKRTDPLTILASSWSDNVNKGFITTSLMSTVPNVSVKFIGRWPEAVPSRKVHILPPMLHKDLAKHLAEGDVFLHAALNDPCPNVVLEALSCGLPVFYHNSGGTPEIARSYGIEITRLQDIGTFWKTVFDMRKQRETLVQKIRDKMYTFSIENAIRQYLEVFKKVLES